LHDIIGGVNGNMSDISISAFDPVFWLHHCNMDRHFYTWVYNNTDHFRGSLYPAKITDAVYESTQAPFFNKDVYSIDYDNYKYGWMNKEIKYMLMKDTLNFKLFPYTYDIIVPKPYIPTSSYVELVNIPVPRESLVFMVYIHPKNKELNRETDFAGSAVWFGINRNERHCVRCETVKTNIKIDIDDFVNENNIMSSNINDYNVVLEGDGRILSRIYNIDELVQDGEMRLVIKN